MPPTKRIDRLFKRLEAFGFNRRYVLDVALPEWWESGMDDTPSGFTQTQILLSRSLGVSLESLLDDSAAIVTDSCAPVKFLRRTGTSEEQLRAAQSVSMAAARIALYATKIPYAGVPTSAAAVRDATVQGEPGPVDFPRLLDYCWSIGIPVLHIHRFPAASRKMDGLALMHKGRPGIILARNTQYQSWLLFHLAYELGHIIKGHIESEGAIVDEKVDMEDCYLREEWEANQFAVKLLTGGDNCNFEFPIRTTGPQLAGLARSVGQTNAIDPGYIALTHGHRTKRWPVSQAAVRILEPTPNALDQIRDRARKLLDLDLLTEESRTFSYRVTGIDAEQ